MASSILNPSEPPIIKPILAKALTNDVELGIKLYRVPVFTALGMSFRALPDDRFRVTDNQEEDERRNVVKLGSVSRIELLMTRADIGMDSRQFEDMGGLLLFKGKKNEAEDQIVSIGSVTLTGGVRDSDHHLWTYTGDDQEKLAKFIRYSNRKPDDVAWRVRTPIMMVSQTSVIDYLAFRCTQLPFLHSIAIKWGDRRWDARQTEITGDMFRPEGERSDMIVLAPVWMDEDMNILDPNIFGQFEDTVSMNLEEYLARFQSGYDADLSAFTETFLEYQQVLAVDLDASPIDVTTRAVARLERKQRVTTNRTLHILFNGNFNTIDNSYETLAFDPTDAVDATEDVFNFENVDGTFRLTSSFEAVDLNTDGWIGDGIATQVLDTPANLPDFTPGEQGSKSMEIATGFRARKMLLPDGDFILKFWFKSLGGKARVEIIRNTRLKEKQVLFDVPTSRVTEIRHFREAYETINTSTIDPKTVGEWEAMFISFRLKDHYFVQDEGLPEHEVYIVFSTEEGSVRFDHLNLLDDRTGTEVEIRNTATRARFPFLLREFERQIDLEFAFQEDTAFPSDDSFEKAATKFQFDGANTCAIVTHRNAFNLHPTGTNINTWFKINSEDETREQVLLNRGAFILFQKAGAFLPSYTSLINDLREFVFSTFEGTAPRSINSKSFRNLNLHTITYERMRLVFNTAGVQARTFVVSELDRIKIPQVDFYLTMGGFTEMNDTVVVIPPPPPIGDASTLVEVTTWKYYEWHARRAYEPLVPAEDLKKFDEFSDYTTEMQNGNCFLPVPINQELVDLPGYFGTFNPSPKEFLVCSPSPAAPSPACFGWPIPVGEWGPNMRWPGSPLFGTSPQYFDWFVGTPAEQMQTPFAAFIDGQIQFDRWFNLDINADQFGIEVRFQGELLAQISGSFTFNAIQERENINDLLIATSNPEDTNTCSPISVYSFKITQRKLPEDTIRKQFEAEAVVFNETLYLTYKDFIDIDKDRVLDFWQDDITDYGLGIIPVDTPPPAGDEIYTDGDYPDDIAKHFGQTIITAPDPIFLTSRPDQDLTVLADFFDDTYLQELVNIQLDGFRDGLIFWDFLTDKNNDFHSVDIEVFDPTCQKRVPKTLGYREWLLEFLDTEFNSTRAVTDMIPTLIESGKIPSPQPPSPVSPATIKSPWPAFGDEDDELILTGVKSTFGFDDLIGYRDSLEKLSSEGMIGNYFQVEFRFRADRTVLDTLLRDFAQSREQIFRNDFVENRLK